MGYWPQLDECRTLLPSNSQYKLLMSFLVIVTESGHSAASEGAGAALKYLRSGNEMTIDQTELTVAPGEEGLSPHTEQIGGQFPSPTEREGQPSDQQSH